MRLIYFFYFLALSFSFLYNLNAQENLPASPSSSYKNPYYNNGKVFENEKQLVLPKKHK